MKTSSLSAPTALFTVPSVRAQLPRFFPRAAISVKTALCSSLLGLCLFCPGMILVGSFPISPFLQQRFLDSSLHPGWVFLTTGFIGPLFEELFYRGLFLPFARRFVSLWVAIVVTSAVFAATHLAMDIAIVALAFPMSCVLSWLAVRTGSLYASFICHCAFNVFPVYALPKAFGLVEKIRAQSPHATLPHPLTALFPVWWTALSVVLIAFALVLLTREVSARRPAAT